MASNSTPIENINLILPKVHTLQDLAASAIAKLLWEKPVVLKRIISYFTNYARHNIYIISGLDQDKPWHEIIEFVKESASQIKIPKSISERLIKMIVLIGNKVYYWKKHVVRDLFSYNEEYIKKIYWTGLNTVDEVKIFYESWQKHYLFNPFYKLMMASVYAQTDFIKKNLMEGVATIEGAFDPLKLARNQCKAYGVISIFVCIFICDHRKNNPYEALRLYKDVVKSKSPASKLFFICLKPGLIRAAKYFYSKIHRTEQQKVLLDAATEMLNVDQNNRFDYSYKKEKRLELFLFIFNKISLESERVDLLSKNFIKICDLFITVWPYQKLLVPMFDSVWFKLDLGEVLEYVLNFLVIYSRTWYHHNKEIAQELFLNILNRMPEELKLKKLIKNVLISKLYEIQDFSTLDLIFEDKHLKIHKDKIVKNNADFKMLVDGGKEEYMIMENLAIG